jgi:pyridoxamine 5'-phosphate oxidase
MAAAEERFPSAVPLPDFWGGLRVAPVSVEFWQGRASRLHDRLRYRLSGKEWVVERLSP